MSRADVSPGGMADAATPTTLRAWQFAGYGSGGMVLAAYYLVSASFLFYATTILHVSPDVAGVVIGLSTLWDALTDLPLGWMSDHTRSQRLGRRHPFLIAGGIAVAVLTVVLWSIPRGLPPGLTIVWLVAALFALKTAISAFVVPHTAMGSDLVESYDGRTTAQAYRATFQVVGMALALIGSSAWFFRPTPAFPQGQLNPAAYAPMGWACAVLILIVTTITVSSTWQFIPRMRIARGAPRVGWRAVRDVLGDHNLRALVFLILATEIGAQLTFALGFHINTFTYGLSGPEIAVLMIGLLVSAVVSQPIWARIARRYDKRPALYMAVALAVVGIAGAPFTHVAWHWFPLAPSAHVVLTLLPFQILAGLGNGAFWSLPYAMVTDCARANENRSGVNLAGAYTGLYIFAYKLGSSLSVALSGFLLGFIGFRDKALVQAPATRYDLAIYPAILLLVLLPVMLLALHSYRLKRADFVVRDAAAAP
ncbi:MAG: MFS transporter [Rhodanobacteraceae bacterium]|nr:MAG: MFS transporter [Rhodanobacteraceae bacterium]